MARRTREARRFRDELLDELLAGAVHPPPKRSVGAQCTGCAPLVAKRREDIAYPQSPVGSVPSLRSEGCLPPDPGRPSCPVCTRFATLGSGLRRAGAQRSVPIPAAPHTRPVGSERAGARVGAGTNALRPPDGARGALRVAPGPGARVRSAGPAEKGVPPEGQSRKSSIVGVCDVSHSNRMVPPSWAVKSRRKPSPVFSPAASTPANSSADRPRAVRSIVSSSWLKS